MMRNLWSRTCPCWALVWLWTLSTANSQQREITRGEFIERDGIARHGTLVEQGIPVPPLTREEALAIRLERTDGLPISAFVEPEATDENGKVVWVRASALIQTPARGILPIRLVQGGRGDSPELKVSQSQGEIRIQSPSYELQAKAGQLQLSRGGRTIVDGPWSVELVGDARAVLWGTYLTRFEPLDVRLEQESKHRATLILRGYIGKNQRKAPTVPEKGRRFDCEFRLHLNALSPNIRFDWRLTNLTGSKTWLQRYALHLPLAPSAKSAVGVTADFLEDLGSGSGAEVTSDGTAITIGGLAMPEDGGFYSRAVPNIHRLFYHGMSRTFSGTLLADVTKSGRAEALAPVDLVLPPQYYSDRGVLPEKGDTVTFGGYRGAVDKAAEWLLAHQWRGTLFWGEWYREWDETRNMGVQEASNGNSPLAPLYHYWRTGDARFLACAKRSANYVWDVQLSKADEGQGRMFHTRRHLFDELDWIHPRYQRATGGLIASHVFTDSRARTEIIETIRSFHQHIFDSAGAPHDWDKIHNRRSANEDGVDTSNFMEALTYCYRETGDRHFLDAALQMSRWTGERWKLAGKRSGDDWNWNLTNYALRGLLTLFETSKDVFVRDLMLQICRTTLANSSTNGLELKDGVGGGELHFVFYHAWISSRIAAYAPDRDDLMNQLAPIVRREVARQRADGTFLLDHGVEAGLPTHWTSYYDSKSLVAYLPVFTARLARNTEYDRSGRKENE